jgi:hypothetical protein
MAKKAAPRKRSRPHPAGAHAPVHAKPPEDARPMAAEPDDTDYDPDLDDQDVDTRPAPSIKVMATKDGYYDDKRRRAGDVFRVRAPYEGVIENDGKETKQTITEFSKKWMKRVAASTPERITTGKQVLRQHHDAEMAARRPSGQATERENPTGSERVLE